MDPIVWTFVILAAAVVGFLSGRIPMGLVAIGVALSLWATGVLGLSEALAGFGDPTVLFIASLFVVAEALDATGVTAWAGRIVLARAGRRRVRIIVFLAAIVGVLTALISINGAVAALVPVAVVIARRARLVPSQLLIPLAFLASAASLLTLTGTPVNVVVSDLAADGGGRRFGFFEFALVGVPLLVATAAVIVVAGQRLLPQRPVSAASADLSVHASSLRERYEVALATGVLFTAREGVSEVIVPPQSRLIGTPVVPGTTIEESVVVLAHRRGDETPDATDPAAAAVRAGDALLVQGQWAALERFTRAPDVLVAVAPSALARTVPLGRGARRTLVVTGLMILALATGLVPPAVAGLVAAGALVLLRAVSVPQAYRAISWTTVVLIAGMIPLSAAFLQTGAADVVAELVLGVVGGASPHLALLVLVIVTVVLGQFISNVATVLVVAPIAISIAQSLELSVQPFMMALTVAGAAAFFTPVATPANLMIMEPGGYRFGDYWRLGLPLAGIFILAAVLYVPLIWPF